MTTINDANNLALYIHWPFCASKCPYCDFNSHVRERYDEDQWNQAIIHELRRYAKIIDGKRALRSIFFGGGTPSLMDPKSTQTIIDEAVKLWPAHDKLEITLEANPNSTETARLKDFRNAGVNRLSLGVQSLNDTDLKYLGRTHKADQAKAAITHAKEIFPRFSFDLIYSRSNQNIEEWQEELEEALTFGASHMSLYQLTIEPGTAFAHKFSKGELPMPSDDKSLQFFTYTNECMGMAGINPYEVSNYAKPGEECAHNLAYWNYQDYLGIGPGAHGRITIDGKKIATRQYKLPETWLKNVNDKANGDVDFLPVDEHEYLSEKLMMGLRLYAGIELKDLSREFLIKSEHKFLQLENAGLIFAKKTRLRLTPKGISVLNGINNYLIN